MIMVTAYGDDERRRAARERGAGDVITKPVDFDNLKHQLRQLSRPRDVRFWLIADIALPGSQRGRIREQ